MPEARLEEENFLMPGFVNLLLQAENANLCIFRDVLAAKGKGLDAREKLEKMRNLKVTNSNLPCSNVVQLLAIHKKFIVSSWQDGNLEVKKVGGITVTKKVKI